LGSFRLLERDPSLRVGVLLSCAWHVPDLDGQKMSKAYNDTISSFREDADRIEKKVRTMTTDPVRVRRADPVTVLDAATTRYRRRALPISTNMRTNKLPRQP